MRKIDYNRFLKLLGTHQPVRIREEDIRYVNEWDGYVDGLGEISIRKMDSPQKIRKARIELKEILSGHPNIESCNTSDEMSPSQIRQFEDDEKERMYTEFEKVASKYPGISEVDTGGYISVWNSLPRPFTDILIHKAAGTKVRIIPINRYRSYSEDHRMIEEMIDNAVEHGNKYDKTKEVYLLWHKCPLGKEIYIVDQGEVEFDLEEKIKNRRALVNSFGKEDDCSGTDVLKSRSEEFEYFSIPDSPNKKKGTLLRIVLERPRVENDAKCDYMGHQLFKPQA